MGHLGKSFFDMTKRIKEVYDRISDNPPFKGFEESFEYFSLSFKIVHVLSYMKTRLGL